MSISPAKSPRISKAEFARRRRQLMAQMGENAIAIIPSARECVRNRDVHFAFRQDSDFHYLTGFNEPDAVAILKPGRSHGEFVLFCRERNPEMELWNGYRAGPEGACKNFGADDAFPIDDLDDILPGLLEGTDRVYYAMGRHADYDHRIIEWVNAIRAKVRSGAHPPGEFLDLDHLLHDMRLYKSAAELAIMREAGRISADAHMRAMRFSADYLLNPGVNEYQLEAEILHEFARQGARHPAYGCIVGSGKNACILHYHENNQLIKDGDLVLIDAGAELDHYAADITRTFPANGKFSREQQALYEIVLESQIQAIAATKPGVHWNAPHEVTVKVITQGLIDLKLLNGELNELIETAAYKPFYMHRAGHWLGIDVHDVGDYKIADEWRVLESGMVMTVEPGIYVALDNADVGRQWRGIGIRIEDDVVVTKTGHEVLTDGVVKTVRDIEKWMKSSKRTVSVAGKASTNAAKKTATKTIKNTTKKTVEKTKVADKKVAKKTAARKTSVRS